jgi:cyclopropane-fatty-acyl-phospholipid synthase
MYERQSRPRLAGWLLAIAARLHPRESFFQSKIRAARNVQFHYDRSNEFYRLFLDSRMVYSCAYFRESGYSLEQAQLAKLDHICRKLDLRSGEQFLDIGCGWGALVLRAAEEHGVYATGCTVSAKQFEGGREAARHSHARERIALYETDYRDMTGRFQKIASVGMFEHVGRRHLGEYFRKAHSLLEDGGLFLNHGLTRPSTVPETAETLFLRREAFPGTELEHLGEVIETAERAGFEVLDVENLRSHYALTCRAWVQRLEQNREACEALVGPRVWRTWRLTLAGCVLSFEEGWMDVNQILLAKRGEREAHHLTREYMYSR